MTFGLFDKATYWVERPADPSDPFSDGGWGEPVTIDCEYKTGSDIKKDRTGAEFMPRTVIYTAVPIPLGAAVIIGESIEREPPTNTETIRASQGGTGLPGQGEEFEHYTS